MGLARYKSLLMSVFSLCREISVQEQFIMAYGGLRGAVGFSLAVILDQQKWYRELFLTTALGLQNYNQIP